MTATPSPLHVSEPVLTTPSSGSPAPPHHAAMPEHATARMDDPPARGFRMGGPAGMGMDMAGCIAGAVCFALLTLAALALAALAGRALDPPSPLAGTSSVRLRRRGPPRARPPSVYRLSVLRL
ncbi:hypothetical protein GEV43_08380 [Actinomadura sp. J1-007]|uniref:hypothetical protein n=1 Tax=Actinomadura sp. J1-007 TaxID=2661913 RepID=UPI0013254EB9|nr:hypothetical protein [Actinomadura sp. J1-007]